MSFNSADEAKAMVLDLITDLRDNVRIFGGEEEIGDLSAVEFFFQRLHPERVMQHLIDKLLPHKKQIERRDQKFFLNNRILFAGLPDDRVDYYTNIIAKGNSISEEERDTIWAYFDSLLALAEDNKKNK
jgi:hypothetical protein